MLFWLLEQFSALNLFDTAALEKTTFRAALAAVSSFTVALILGPRWIAWLKVRFREPIISASATLEKLHRDKQWTPTMGGLFIVAGIVIGALAFGDLSNPFLQLALLLSVALAILGAVDDLSKLRSGSRGMRARVKLISQIAICTVVALLVFRLHAEIPGALMLHLPLADTPLALGWWFVPLAVAVMVGTSNAANLTDGLDGLAGGCLVFSTLGMAALAYAAGHAGLAQYLGISHIPGASEAVVWAGGTVGGLLGFLWFNCHPAQVFMGDTGSLSLGGLLGFLAITARQELLLLVVAGVLVIEALSVILQVTVYKWKRRRVFLCAPLHHHFQFSGLPESRIVVRFWIVSALCALLGVAGTKLTVSDPSSSRWQIDATPSAAAGDVRK